MKGIIGFLSHFPSSSLSSSLSVFPSIFFFLHIFLESEKKSFWGRDDERVAGGEQEDKVYTGRQTMIEEGEKEDIV